MRACTPQPRSPRSVCARPHACTLANGKQQKPHHRRDEGQVVGRQLLEALDVPPDLRRGSRVAILRLVETTRPGWWSRPKDQGCQRSPVGLDYWISFRQYQAGKGRWQKFEQGRRAVRWRVAAGHRAGKEIDQRPAPAPPCRHRGWRIFRSNKYRIHVRFSGDNWCCSSRPALCCVNLLDHLQPSTDADYLPFYRYL